MLKLSSHLRDLLAHGCRIDKAMNDLKEKLATAYKASGGRKVDIISHSMGGLLIKCFISLYSDVSAIA